VANYVAPEKRDVAEAAVVVAHEDHLRGVATALIRRLAEIALSNEIRSFTADVLADNSAMLTVLSDACWRHTTRFGGSVLNIRIDLSDLDERAPDNRCQAGPVRAA
jgi:Acetyltransferase (GNAT) family